ncbi:Serine protease gd [Atta colombica]|uniref:Serine protease gd n=1 Tax=Atta colombica TaxID=520822 RepID=A0A195BL56_9HYME|nr:Serine protease gd [Atta colombica]
MIHCATPYSEYFTYIIRPETTGILGQIEILSPPENDEFYLRMALNSIAMPSSKDAFIRLELARPVKESILAIRRGRPLLYHVYFPSLNLDKPIPTVNNKYKFQCAGTILSNSVLTAGHCLIFNSTETIPSNVLIVALGRFKLHEWREVGTVNREVASYEVHPDYVHTSTTGDFDLAILVLREDCLWNHPLFVTITSNRMFCAGSPNIPCNSDSGSGLVLQDETTNRYEICNVPLKMGNFICGSPYCTDLTATGYKFLEIPVDSRSYMEIALGNYRDTNYSQTVTVSRNMKRFTAEPRMIVKKVNGVPNFHLKRVDIR